MAQDCDVNEEEVDAMLAPLMGFLDDRLAILNHNLYQSVFDHVLRVCFQVEPAITSALIHKAGDSDCAMAAAALNSTRDSAGAVGEHLQVCGGHCLAAAEWRVDQDARPRCESPRIHHLLPGAAGAFAAAIETLKFYLEMNACSLGTWKIEIRHRPCDTLQMLVEFFNADGDGLDMEVLKVCTLTPWSACAALGHC
jgi:hypothetical protein